MPSEAGCCQLKELNVYMVVLGLLLLILKWAGYGPVAQWSYWMVLCPFALAVIWWAYADASGWTKQREIDKMEERKKKRRQENLEALGMDPRSRRKR